MNEEEIVKENGNHQQQKTTTTTKSLTINIDIDWKMNERKKKN